MTLNNGFDDRGHIVVPDRREAIRLAIRVAKTGDTVLIAGKGHETHQIIGRRSTAFDDREEARRALTSDSNRPGKEGG